jgi:GT2 family glycosyltransferase
MAKDLSIIILNYNTKKLLGNLLSSIFNSDLKNINLEVIVVDNGSKDNSAGFVKKYFPKVKVIENKKNYGFSKGSNIGAKKAKGKYLLFLNSDTLVFKKTIKKMLGFLDKKTSAAAATCFLKMENGRIDPASHRGFPTPWAALSYFLGLEKLFSNSRFFGQYHKTWKNLKKTHQIDVISGAFFMIRRKIFDSLAGFDEDYFMYGEDIDLCYRLHKKGEKIYFYPHTKAVHLKKRSGRQRKAGNENEQEYENSKLIREKTSSYFFNTMKTFYKKHYENKYPKLVKNLVLCGIFIVSKFKK